MRSLNLVIIRRFLFVLCFIFSSLIATAQDQAGGGNDIVEDSLKDFYTVFAVGAGGAILGLSTLSFADKPGDHLKNIWVGASIGIIIGVGVVAWGQASESQNFYNDNARIFNKRTRLEFGTVARNSWHQREKSRLQKKLKTQMPFITRTFTF